jgi:hypothetical protein
MKGDKIMKKKVNLSLDEDVALELKHLAENEYKTVSAWVTDAVVKNMRNNKSKAKGKKCNEQTRYD